MSNSELEAVVEKLCALFAAEYHRGEQDAIARIMQAAQIAPHAAAALPNGKADHPIESSVKNPQAVE